MTQYTIGNWCDPQLTPQSVVDDIKIQIKLAINNQRLTRSAIKDLDINIMIGPVGDYSTPINIAKFKVSDTERNLIGYFYADQQLWEPAKKNTTKPPSLIIKPDSRVLRSYKTGAEYDKDQPYEMYNAHGWRGCGGCTWKAYNTLRISKKNHADMLNRSSIRSRNLT